MGCGSSKSEAPANKPDQDDRKKAVAQRVVAWRRIRKVLPRAKTAEDKARRIELFKEFDTNKTGSLTLEQTYKGCVDVLHLDEFTDRLRDIVKRAFNKAKDLGTKAESAGSENLVEFLEFRMMLCYIYDYFQLTVVFDEIDSTGNGLLDVNEFKEAARRAGEYGITISDPEKTFKEIDGNGSGQVTFDEFASWVSAKKMEREGDPDA